ncbi:MAG: hypothetical protein CMI56_03150 [Parcubacteria group bacterium]|nr:hypothetical protein [Parcubacteria group bacterium]
MKNFLKKIIRLIQTPFILLDYLRFTKNDDERFALRLQEAYPCLKDKTIKTGFDRHYVYHTAWAARVLFETKPVKHIDIASSLYFAGIASAFTPIDFYDYRPADISLSNLTSNAGDLMNLPFEDASVPSISSMHVVEHIGLGRYGDSIDPAGDIKAANELTRVLSKGGQLLFVVPIGGTAKIEYNAHRIYTYDAVLNLFPTLKLKEFSFIPEHGTGGGLQRNADPALLSNENYACGCFLFTK